MTSIWEGLASQVLKATLSAPGADVSLGDLRTRTSLSEPLHTLAGRSVLIATRSQLAAALAILELEGVARRLVIGTPDLPSGHFPVVMNDGEVDAIVCDDDRDFGSRAICVTSTVRLGPKKTSDIERRATEWVLLTSGTTGAPKLVVHTLATLTSAIPQRRAPDVVWATFYDMRRYGGLQIFLRAMCGGGSFVMSDADESPAAFLERLGAHGVTHLSGTPSHWRRALMSPSSGAIAPRYVRMSGEIADQAIINSLRARYPQAGVSHAFASTEAGVGFAVDDGLAGFPASYIGSVGNVDVQVVDGSLRLRSPGVALRYLGTSNAAIVGEDGFVDTGDAVELRDDRYHFLGRKSGLINIGGLKVYPEEVEAAINRHPAVRMSLVRAKKSPITGALVAADVVLKTGLDDASKLPDLKREILALCHDSLPAHKVPATIRFVPALNVAAAGKLARTDA